MEFAAARYGWTPEQMLAMPVATLLALHTAALVRDGWDWREPSYLESERLEQEDDGNCRDDETPTSVSD